MKPISRNKMVALKESYLSKTKKAIMENGKENYRQLNDSDTKTSWFSKADIQQLFAENLDENKIQGLTIHIITHDVNKYAPPRADHDNQHTVVLTVSNEDGEPIIDDTENLKFKFKAKGAVSDKLCPPEICTGS